MAGAGNTGSLSEGTLDSSPGEKDENTTMSHVPHLTDEIK